MKTPADRTKFTEALTTTIQCIAGTMRPPVTMLTAYYDALKDLELKDLLRVLKQWERNSNSWPAPASIRAAIEGRPDQDTFDDYIDNYIARGRAGEFKHPIGKQVIAAMGGSGVFQTFNVRERPEWKQRWIKAYRKIANAEGTKVSPSSE
jgi:hypothetical protein